MKETDANQIVPQFKRRVTFEQVDSNRKIVFKFRCPEHQRLWRTERIERRSTFGLRNLGAYEAQVEVTKMARIKEIGKSDESFSGSILSG